MPVHSVDEERAIRELRQRVVECAVGELVLERGEPEQIVVVPAALDGEGDEVSELLQALVAGSRLATSGGSHAQRQVADRPRLVAKGDGKPPRAAERLASARPTDPRRIGEVDDAVYRRCQTHRRGRPPGRSPA